MMHFKRTFVVILLLTVAVRFAAIAQTDEGVDLPVLYQEIDDAINHSKQFISIRESQIKDCRDSLLNEQDLEKQVALAGKLFSLFEPYRNDSALYYAQLCISLGDSLRRPDISGRFRSLVAYQCSNCNMYSESFEQLSKVKRSALDQVGLVDYYKAWMHVYGELGSFTQIKDMRRYYFDMQNLYRDSVMMVAKEGSEDWLHLKMDILSARQSFQEALSINNQWLKRVHPNTHESAFAAFYRSIVYDKLQNHDQKCYWLGRSALEDIRCAVMNQASLLFLAEQLADDGDIDRARSYMEFTRDCNMFFLPRVRIYQINPYINILEKSCQAAEAKADNTLLIAAVVIGLLLVVLFVILIRKRK
jgi:tetratricopeptide (TPR) repeat protein